MANMRAQFNLSQKEIWQIIGVNKNTYKDYEVSKKNVQLQISKFYKKVSLSYYINKTMQTFISNKIVDYTLKYINKPVGVSKYKIFNKLYNALSKKLPTKEDIEMHINIDNE